MPQRNLSQIPIFGNTVEERYRSLLSHIAQTDRDDSVRGRRI